MTNHRGHPGYQFILDEIRRLKGEHQKLYIKAKAIRFEAFFILATAADEDEEQERKKK